MKWNEQAHYHVKIRKRTGESSNEKPGKELKTLD